MLTRRNHQRPCQEEDIEDLLQEVARLRLRLSRIERRENLSSLSLDFNGAWGKYAAPTDSKSFVPTKSLRTDDGDEGILDDQLSSTPPSIKFSFKEFEDPLPKSSFLPLYDELMYNVYDDDMFSGVLDLEQPTDDKVDKSKPIQEVIAEKNNGGVDRNAKCTENVDVMISAFECVHDGLGVIEHKEGNHVLPIFTGECKESVHCMGVGSVGLGAAESARIGVPSKCIPSAYATFKKLKIGRQFDTGWKYPDRFSQPNPPPYDSQPDIFSTILKFLLPL